MKKIKLFLAAAVALMFFAVKVNAQTPATYYVGKWDVLVKGTPQGDVHLKFTVSQKDGVLTSVLENPETQKEEPTAKTEIKDDKLNIAFTIQTYDLTLTLGKKDDDHTAGSLMGMFDAEGVRVK